MQTSFEPYEMTYGEMLFNSLGFLIFFPTVCIIYFLLRKNNYRVPFLLIASYFFYMNWKPIYAVLILLSTIITYFCGVLVENHSSNQRKKKIFLVSSLVINFSILFLFKYYNFINGSIFSALSAIGLRWSVPNLEILLPVGISFYTFQAVGYSIDVYRGDIKAERNFLTYALFVSFFPQLVAGPIERAKNLLPQFHKKNLFSYENAVEGFKLMLWGFFMKLCVADTISSYVDAVYNNVGQHNGTSMLLATILFTFQIYCDFGGYSLIAKGCAKIMGYDLMINFKQPYLATNIKEFWKRWHISLSTWFMDYLYIPLGGNRVKFGRHLLNLLITFVVSGIWHGADWTFVLWGLTHGIYIVIYNIIKHIFPSIEKPRLTLLRTFICFAMVAFAWIFFRANSIEDAFTIIGKIFTQPGALFTDKNTLLHGTIALMILFAKDIKDNFGWKINFMHSKYSFVRYTSVSALIIYILLFGALDGGAFIYFQF